MEWWDGWQWIEWSGLVGVLVVWAVIQFALLVYVLRFNTSGADKSSDNEDVPEPMLYAPYSSNGEMYYQASQDTRDMDDTREHVSWYF